MPNCVSELLFLPAGRLIDIGNRAGEPLEAAAAEPTSPAHDPSVPAASKKNLLHPGVTVADLLPMDEAHLAASLMPIFDASIAEGRSVTRSLLDVAGSPFWLAAFFQLINVGALSFYPYTVFRFIDACQRGASAGYEGLGWAFGFFFSMWIGLCMNQVCLQYAEVAALRVRAVAALAVYRRVLVMRQHRMDTGGYAAVASVVSTETQRFLDAAPHFHLIWASPLQVGLSTYVMLSFFSTPAVVGLAVLLGVYPVGMLLSRLQGWIRATIVPITRTRIRHVAELVQGIRVAKLNGWEPLLLEKIIDTRRKEFSLLKYDVAFWVMQGALMILVSQIASLGAFGV